jgi:hypothetical protein
MKATRRRAFHLQSKVIGFRADVQWRMSKAFSISASATGARAARSFRHGYTNFIEHFPSAAKRLAHRERARVDRAVQQHLANLAVPLVPAQAARSTTPPPLARRRRCVLSIGYQ